ncbi:hypothetical protein RFI_04539, partial [Reticulomyxa filosa]
MKAVDSEKTPSLYYRDFTITKNVTRKFRVGMCNNPGNGKATDVAIYSLSYKQSACLVQKKKGFSQQNHDDTQRDYSIFLHLLSSINISADDFEFVSSAYSSLAENINLQNNQIEELYNEEIINWKIPCRHEIKPCNHNLSSATLLDAVHITAKQCNNEPPKDVKDVLKEQYRALCGGGDLDPMEKLTLVPCFNYCSAFGYETGPASECVTKINFAHIDDKSIAEKAISILKVDLVVRTTKKCNQIPVERHLVDLMAVYGGNNEKEYSEKILNFLLGPECLKTEVWGNVFGHKSFGKVILNLFQSDFKKWHIFLQTFEDKKLLSENMQLFFTLFNSKEFMHVLALSSLSEQWKHFFEDFVLKETKIWTEESKVLKTVEVCLNTENVSHEGMPILLDILWTHVAFKDNDIKDTVKRLTNSILLKLQSNVEYHSLWLQQFRRTTKHDHLWKTLLQKSLRGWLQYDSSDGKPESSSLHFHRKVIQLLSYPDFYKLTRTYLDFFISEVKLQQQKMALDGEFWNTKDIECVQQCFAQPSVNWTLWNEVFDTIICVPTLTWEVETKRKDLCISDMLLTQCADIKSETDVPRDDNTGETTLQLIEDEKAQSPNTEERSENEKKYDDSSDRDGSAKKGLGIALFLNNVRKNNPLSHSPVKQYIKEIELSLNKLASSDLSNTTENKYNTPEEQTVVYVEDQKHSGNNENIELIFQSTDHQTQEELREERLASQNAHVLKTGLAYCFKYILWTDIIFKYTANVRAFELFVNFVKDMLSHLFELVKDDTITSATCKFVCANGNEDKVAKLVELSKQEITYEKLSTLVNKYKQFDTI